MPIKEYIALMYESQAHFARVQGVAPAQVTQWINMNCIVINEIIYSPRRNIK